MSASPPAPPNASPAAGENALRLVLFGLPAAGKSSLLGALGHTASHHADLLGGKLDDPSHGLTELARQLYEETTHRTPREVVPYPIRYQPQGSHRPIEAVLLDCDGEVANQILHDAQSLDDGRPEGTLAYEMVEADAVILVIDASSQPGQVEAIFAEFGEFLAAMQAGRGARAEVAGLPVFLVLTKCDLLAQSGDNAGAWMDRIEQRKREVGERFRAFLADPPPQPDPDADSETPSEADDSVRFGKIALHVWATAVKRPALVGGPARPREPYGVAELFRQCLGDAAVYRARYERSQKKLMRLLLVASLLVGILGMLAVTMFFVNVSTRVSLLQSRVEDFRFLDRGTPAERLKGFPDQLRAKLGRLEEIHDDPYFSRLPSASREFVEGRMEELKSYIPYLEKLLALPRLAEERTEEGLDRAIDRLRNELAPPREEWADTLAGQMRQERLDGAEAMRKAIQAARNAYLDLADRATRLWTFADFPPPAGIDWADWARRAEAVLDPDQRAPFRDGEPVPGVPGGVLTFSAVLRFDRVIDARTAWETERSKLGRLLDLASSLGVTPTTRARPPLLVFTHETTLASCQVRLAELKKEYPEYEKAFTRDSLSEAALPRIRQAAQVNYESLLRPARDEVLRQLRQASKGAEETATRWQLVRAWLRKPEELAEWRELARVLQRLRDPVAADPVQVLAEFLAKDQFPLEVRSVGVEVPDLRGLRPRAEARLVVLHPASMRQPALTLEPSGKPTHDPVRRVTTYTFRTEGAPRLVYRPGDKLWVELPLSGGKERLVWSQSRSARYQFERLQQAPRVQTTTARTLDEGRVLDDIKLVLRPDDGVPPVPDLMPSVRLD